QEAAGSDAEVEQLHVHDAPVFVMPGTRVLVAQACVQRETRRDLPVVLNVAIVGAAAQHTVGHGCDAGGEVRRSQHVVGENIAGRTAARWIESGLPVETELSRYFLVTILVVAIAAHFDAELDGVPAASDREVVGELEGGIAGDPRGHATETVEAA